MDESDATVGQPEVIADPAAARAVFDHALDAMLIADSAGKLVDVNPAACVLLGLSREELLERGLEDIVPHDMRASASAAWKEFLATGAQRGDIRLVRADGTTREVEYSATANVLPGRHLSVLRDVERHKRAEDGLRFLGEASAVLAGSLDYQATLVSLAQLAVPRIADWAVVDMLEADGGLHRLAVAHVNPDKVERARDLDRRFPFGLDAPRGVTGVLRTGEPEIYPEIPDSLLASSADDHEMHTFVRSLGLTSAMCVPLRVRDRTIGVITLLSAESVRRFGPADLALAEELARRASVAVDNALSFREAQEANRIKDEFLATVSHELRTPLTAILGWSALLRSSASDQSAVERGLEAIERNARAQARIIDDVLDVSRIISGKLRLELKRVDMATVVSSALEIVGPMADARGIVIESQVGRDAVAVFGDADRLQQVVWNLASNAIKFTPKGGRVGVRVDGDGAAVQLQVTDTGQGISPQFLPYIFDRFRQADSSSTRKHGGLGLGLAIARHLVELHGGTLKAESAGEGLGASFTMTLPVRAVQVGSRDSGVSRPADAAPAREANTSALGGLRVLVCDDEADARELIAAVLAAYGAQVRAAGSAFEVIASFAEFKPHVLVSDIGMPGIDGYGLMRHIRNLSVEQGGSVPSLALTAYARSEDVQRALAAGFQHHLAKPVDPRELIAAVSALGGR